MASVHEDRKKSQSFMREKSIRNRKIFKTLLNKYDLFNDLHTLLWKSCG